MSEAEFLLREIAEGTFQCLLKATSISNRVRLIRSGMAGSSLGGAPEEVERRSATSNKDCVGDDRGCQHIGIGRSDRQCPVSAVSAPE
jgi:hypothetical protein